MNILHRSSFNTINVLQKLSLDPCRQTRCTLVLLPLALVPLVYATRCFIPYSAHVPCVRTLPTLSDFTFIVLNASGSSLTFFSLLVGRSTVLIVAAFPYKGELQFLCPYDLFLMSFSFPSPIPASIRVPHYAYLDVVVIIRFISPEMLVELNLSDRKYIQCRRCWDCRYVRRTYSIGLHLLILASGGPESTPAAVITTSVTILRLSSTVIATSTTTATLTTATATSTPIARSSKLNTGVIAGGIVEGVVFLGIVAGLAFMRHRKSKPSQPAPFTHDSVPLPGKDD